MSSYNSYDGTPVAASYHIMREILRDEWVSLLVLVDPFVPDDL
jgi:hypothetical protein